MPSAILSAFQGQDSAVLAPCQIRTISLTNQSSCPSLFHPTWREASPPVWLPSSALPAHRCPSGMSGSIYTCVYLCTRTGSREIQMRPRCPTHFVAIFTFFSKYVYASHFLLHSPNYDEQHFYTSLWEVEFLFFEK